MKQYFLSALALGRVTATLLLALVPAAIHAAEERDGAHETIIAGDYFGTGATASPANHPLARQLGATEVTDYRAGPPKGPFDVILDVMGSLGWNGAEPLLSPTGRLILITADLSEMLASTLNRRFLIGTSKEDLTSMRRLVDLHLKGGYTPIIGPVLPFEQLTEAHRIAESFHKPGNLVITMGDAR